MKIEDNLPASQPQSQEYYLNGFVQRSFKVDTTLEELNRVLREIDSGALRSGFQWKKIFEGTEDLSPEVYKYHPIFIDFALKQGLIDYARSITGEHLHLDYINLRKVYPGTVYMGWHRDTYIYKNHPAAGLRPAVHKIIYYPSLGESGEAQLKLLPGSQRHVFTSKLVDRLQTVVLPRKTVVASDREFVLFNSSLFHSTTDVKRSKGCYRLFYCFLNTHHHKKLMDRGFEEALQLRARELGVSI